MRRLFSLLLLVFVFAGPTWADNDDSFAARAESMLDSVYPADGPGAAVFVSRAGEPLLDAAFGLANVELDVPLQTDHVFRLASVTKQYAAATLLSLIEAGELALDDPLSEVLPGFPVGEVTIAQLLNHTSGIRSYTSIPGYMDSDRVRADLTTEELVAVFADEPVDFKPGERFAYNNSGYVLVGAVIEAVTGQPWNEVLRERLLLPNGIEQTDVWSDTDIVPGRVEGYSGPPDQLERAPFLSMTQPHAAGALMATAADVDLWQRKLHGGDILGDALYQRMIRPEGAAVDTDFGFDYGYGIVAATWFGQRALHHGGGIFGFSTHALYLPDEKLSVVVLSNRIGPGSGWGPEDVALRLAGLATGRAYPLEVPEEPRSEAQLLALQGTYEIADNVVRTLKLEDGVLISQRGGGPRFTVRPIAGDRLKFDQSLSWFSVDRNEAGEVLAVSLHSGWGEAPERAEKISDEVQARQSVDVPAEQLERLAGQYELMPNFIMTVRVTEGQLEVQATGQPSLVLQAESSTRFFNTQVGADIAFDLPETGSATGLTLFQGGREMPAPRVELQPTDSE